MKCSAFESLIALQVEGDLPESDRARVETHLKGCAACHDLAEDLRQSQSVFHSLRLGTVNSSDLAGVRARVLNEIGGMEPAPGWAVAMHRLLFAGLRRRNAIAGVVLAVLISEGVWYAQRPAITEKKSEAPVEEARLEAPSSVVSMDVSHPPAAVARIAKVVEPQEVLEVPPVEPPAVPLIDAPVVPEPQISQIPMKFVTDDPNIIIYWLPADKGD